MNKLFCLLSVAALTISAPLSAMEFKEAAPTADEFKAAVEELGKAWKEFKETHKEEIKGLEKKFDDVVTADKLKKINEALDAAIEKKEALDRRLTDIEKKVGRPGGGDDKVAQAAELELKAFNLDIRSSTKQGKTPPELDREAYEGYKAAFADYLMKGGKPEALEAKDMMVVSDPDGGYLVPADMSGRIIVRMRETSPMRLYADIVQTATDTYAGLNDLGETECGWIGETEPRDSDTGTPQLGKYEIPVHEIWAQPKASQKLLDDAAVDVEGWLAGKIADAFSRKENASFVVGDGNKKPRGFTDYSTAATADADRSWGTFQHRNTGANGAFASSAPADVLMDLVADLKEHFLPNARWFGRRTTLWGVRKFKGATTGDYLWQPGLTAGQPPSLLGYPVATLEDMPALTTGSLSMAFGDMKQAYTIVDRLGMRTLRDPLTKKGWVKFYTTKRVGGGAADFEALKFLRFAA